MIEISIKQSTLKIAKIKKFEVNKSRLGESTVKAFKIEYKFKTFIDNPA